MKKCTNFMYLVKRIQCSNSKNTQYTPRQVVANLHFGDAFDETSTCPGFRLLY